MSIGIGVLNCRLDSDVPAAALGGVDWDDFRTWCGPVRPGFAAKYLVGSPWRWVHGEASSLIPPARPNEDLRLVPVQASDPVRQAEVDDLGAQWGAEDGKAIGEVIGRGVELGEFGLATKKPVRVYLEVAADTALTSDYWAGWSTAIRNVVLARFRPGVDSVPIVGQLLLPCIATPFTATGTTWQVPGTIASALVPKPDQLGANRCFGFWAVTTDPATITAAAPPWPNFAEYSQPQPNGAAVPVPVRLWRFATGDAGAPVHQVGRITLEATKTDDPADPELDRMLALSPWSATDEPPTQIGIDRGAPVLGIIGCLQLAANKLTVRHLPEATLGGSPGPALDTPLKANPSFVGRYYSQTRAGRPILKDLTASEAKALSVRGLGVASFFQARIEYPAVAAYLANKDHGYADGKAAAWFAATKVKQPAHTPIYFAVDCDVTTSGVSTRSTEHAVTEQQLIDYFTQVNKGVAEAFEPAEHAQRSPYAVGVYACRRAFDLLYARGLASHFWQAFPPFWGDDLAGQQSNDDPWLHANLWQVALAGNAPVQTLIGISKCKNAFTFNFLFSHVDDPSKNPASLKITKGAAVSTIPFKPDQAAGVSAAAMQAVVGGHVEFGDADEPGKGVYVLQLPNDPAPLKIEPVDPYDHAAFQWELRHDEGIADVNVAWGDPGSWRLEPR